MLFRAKQIEEEKENKRNSLRTIAGVFFVLAFILGGLAAFNLVYAERIYPNVSIGYVNVSGLTREAAYHVVSEHLERGMRDGLRVRVGTHEEVISLNSFSPDDPDLTRQVIDTDIDSAVDEAFLRGRQGSLVGNFFLPLAVMVEGPRLVVPTVVDSEEVQNRINVHFPEYSEVPEPTRYDAVERYGEWEFDVVEGETREVLVLNDTLSALTIAVSEVDPVLESHVWTIPIVTVEPLLSTDEAQTQIEGAQEILAKLPLNLQRENDGDFETIYTLSDEDVAPMLLPTLEGVQVDSERMEELLLVVAEDINREPLDARLILNPEDPSRVSEFIPSETGVEMNLEESLERVVGHLYREPGHQDVAGVVLTFTVKWPDVQVADTNDLGIKEVLGVGTSDFSGSPSNRIKNIRNGVKKLNGLLIGPEETISLVQSLRPFTFDNGYLPELVIKGDKIEPELGGGLCQIGTTTFRATMNAGLAIAQRRNHSLVVGYYDDPSNGNPGTDATLYEPNPDYKFTNDTENYIMLQTEMNVYTGELKFTFWGTPDGRKGSYTAPEVLEWYGAGETQYIETEDLEIGEERCQGAHPGAFTAFTYNVEYGDGSTHEEEYTSRYRSLPRICLVGIDPDAVEEETEGEEGGDVETEELEPEIEEGA